MEGFLSEIIQIDLKDIIFKGIEKFNSIVEYDFYLAHIIGIAPDNSRQEIFIKRIKKGKIKESLFCICDLFYEKYLNENNYLKENLKKSRKITILENKEENLNQESKVLVNLFEDDLIQEKVNIEISFIEISKIIEQYKNKLKGWKKYIEIYQNDILIVGVKNKH